MGRPAASSPSQRSAAFIYLRQSTYREESISLEVQLQHCEEHCRRQGLTVVEVITDADLSGRSFLNRSITPTIERVRRGEASRVVVWKWSRWGRNLVESLRCLAELKEAGGRLEAATEPIDASTPAGRFSVTQMLAIAEFQSDVIGETWRDAMRSMIFKKGLPPTGGPRLGYVYDSRAKLYTPHPVAGPAMAEAYAQYIRGASLRRVAAFLRDRGVRTSRGNPVVEPGLRHSLDSGFAAGLIRLDNPADLLSREQLDEAGYAPGEPLWIPGRWEPLIDEDTWRQYQDRRSHQRALPPRARNAVRPLSRILRCAGCGKRMIHRHERGRWVCTAQNGKIAAPGGGCLVHVSVSDAEATAFVHAWLTEHRDGSGDAFTDRVQRELSAQRLGSDIAALEEDLARDQRRLDNLVDAIADGVLEREDAQGKLQEVRARIAETRTRIGSARREQSSALSAPREAFGALLDAWEDADPGVLNHMLSLVLADVFVYPFRTSPRMIARGVWEPDKEAPRAAPPDLDFSDGRTCLGCGVWKPASEFYRRSRGNLLMSRCKECKAAAHAEWRSRGRTAT